MLALAGLWVLSMGVEGWYRGRVDPVRRVVLIAAAILMPFPPNHTLAGIDGYWLMLAGAILASVILAPRFTADTAKQGSHQ